MVTVLHRVSPGYDVAAWYLPTRGVWGVVITAAEALTIIAAMVMAASAAAVKRRVGLVVMASWGAYWAWSIGRVAWLTRDGTDMTLAGVAAAAFAAQLAVCALWWANGPRANLRGH